MIIFRCKAYSKTNAQIALQKRIVDMMKDGVVVIPPDVEIVYTSDDHKEENRAFGFAQAIGFEMEDPELEEEEDE